VSGPVFGAKGGSRMSAFCCRLELEGITSDSRDPGQRSQIDVLSFSWSQTRNVPAQSGLGSGVGLAHVTDLHLVARTGAASPLVMVACAAGRIIPIARLTCSPAGIANAEFLVMTLTGVLVSGYQITGAVEPDAALTDEIVLHFTDITFEYRARRPDGTLGGTVKGEWNVRENRSTDPGR
jgi:type VI secretion system secreted protein Hcp